MIELLWRCFSVGPSRTLVVYRKRSIKPPATIYVQSVCLFSRLKLIRWHGLHALSRQALEKAEPLLTISLYRPTLRSFSKVYIFILNQMFVITGALFNIYTSQALLCVQRVVERRIQFEVSQNTFPDPVRELRCSMLVWSSKMITVSYICLLLNVAHILTLIVQAEALIQIVC